MRHHEAGRTVPGGFYWNEKTWEIVPLNGETGVLPGDASTRYLKVPAVALVLGAPVLGGLFVMFLPFIGIALAGRELFRQVGMASRRTADELAVRLAPAWQPGVAHLTGGKENGKDETGKETPGTPTELESLEKKVEELRRDEK